MTNLIQRITEAIIRQEGEPLTALNPGNLRFAPWLTNPKIVNGFWVPDSRKEGIAGVAHCVALHIAEGHSLAFMIGDPVRGWAPKADHNNTIAYIKNIKTWAEIPDENAPLWNYIEDGTL